MIYFILILILILYIYFKFYRLKYDTIVAYTGGLGSGKSFESTKIAIKLYKKNLRLVKRQNLKIRLNNLIFKQKKEIHQLPNLYSSIPLRIKKNKWAIILTEEHLTLQKKLTYKSVVFIDEVGSYASQFEYNNPNIKDNFDEFIRLFRHYTKGGYLVVNDQCSENIVLQIRRRINQVYNLMHFQKWFFFFYTIRVRNMNISEEIKTIEEFNSEDSMSTIIGIINPFFRRYDTYCYSERYSTVPFEDEKTYQEYKKYDLLQVSKNKLIKLTTNEKR